MVDESDDRNPVEVLGEEFLERRRRGEQTSVSEYAAAYPDLSREIKRLFPTMIALERFKVGNIVSPSDNVSSRFEGLKQLGDFRIIREIGRGGMGVVFEAEQESLRRHVAVKVFPRTMLCDARRLARFQREAQTAARLHHTNIVPVFGVGDQDGLHYFVMQRINGIAMDQWLRDRRSRGSWQAAADDAETDPALMSSKTEAGSDSNFADQSQGQAEDGQNSSPGQFQPPTPSGPSEWRWLADVGIQVAEALAYAHSQGVLHRDIKPGNLLLDPAGTVWVTDFGLATILQAEPQADSQDVAGTLRFMAPEQIGGQQDSRSDIYSLGLTLYELLTGCPAFAEGNQSRLIEKIVNGQVAAPREIRRGIPKDLEAIVQKAIATDPQQRYRDAQSLAMDLRRFIDGRPVRARPIGPVGRIRRWGQRSPVVAGLTTTLILLAIASFALISTNWRQAVAENRRAESNLSLALDSMDRILERFTSGWMAHPTADGEPATDSEEPPLSLQIAVSNHSAAVLQDAVQFYDQFAKQNTASPRLRRETAKVHRRVGDIYERLGRYAKAEQAYNRSLQILASAQIGNEDDVSLAIESASSRNQLGLAMYETGRFDEAASQFRLAKQILSAEKWKQNSECRAELARTHNHLGRTLWIMRQPEQAKNHHRKAIEILEELTRQRPGYVEYRLSLARAYRDYYPFVRFGRSDGERTRIRNAGTQILEQLVEDFPEVPDYQSELSETLVSTVSRTRGFWDIDPQVAQLERAIELAQRVCEEHPSIPSYRVVLARAHRDLGRLLERRRRTEAELHFGEAADIYRKLAREFADTPVYSLFLAMTLEDHAAILRRLDRLQEARAAAEEGIAIQTNYRKLRPQSEFGTGVQRRLYDELASILTKLELPDEAEQAQCEAEHLYEQTRRRFGSRRRGR